MEEQRIVGLRILHQPMHRTKNIRLGRLAHGVLLIIRQNNHVLARIPEVLVQVCGHVLHVIDATAKLTLLVEIIDSNQQSLSLTSTSRVLEVVSLRRTVSE